MGKDVKTLSADLVPRYSDEQVPSGTYQREESGKRANPGGAQVLEMAKAQHRACH